MKRAALLFLLAVSCATVLAAQTAQPKIADLGWLAGCWEMKNVDRGVVITEMWLKPDGGSMLSVGRTVKNGKTVDYEYVRLVEDANGLAYIPKPSVNKEETNFKLVKADAGGWVFENLDHDFPQRIIYRSIGKHSLLARIEGTENGKPRGVDYPYKRVSCE